MRIVQEDSPLVTGTGVRTQIMQPTITNSEAFWYNSDESVEVSKARPLVRQVDSSTNIVIATERDESNATVIDNVLKKEKDLVNSTKLYDSKEPAKVK